MLLLLLLSASPAAGIDAPGWVGIDALYCRSGDRVYAYASGASEGIRNRSLAVGTADNRARSGISNLVNRGRASPTTTMIGMMVVERWSDPRDCAPFSLARWEASAVTDAPPCSVVLPAKRQLQRTPRAPGPSLVVNATRARDTKDARIFQVDVTYQGLGSADGVTVSISGVPAPLSAPATLRFGDLVSCRTATAALAIRGLPSLSVPPTEIQLTAQDRDRKLSASKTLPIVEAAQPRIELTHFDLRPADQRNTSGVMLKFRRGRMVIADYQVTNTGPAYSPPLLVRFTGSDGVTRERSIPPMRASESVTGTFSVRLPRKGSSVDYRLAVLHSDRVLEERSRPGVFWSSKPPRRPPSRSTRSK